MSRPPASAFPVLHALRVKGVADDEAIALATGLDSPAVVAACTELTERGLIARRHDKAAGWTLTDPGRTELAALARAALTSEERERLQVAYRGFLPINRELLATCTAWQLREGPGGTVINDHSDPRWDDRVLDRLRVVDAEVRPVIGQLTAVAPRYGRYGHRLAVALEKVVAGETEWFTRPQFDSYHSVWFELHEDLLATLGIERSTEGQR